MATTGRAEALGLDSATGFLEPGKGGDFALFDPRGVRSVPMEAVSAPIVDSLDAGDVDRTIVDRRFLVDNKRLVVLDEEELVRDRPGEVEKLLRRDAKGLTP